MGLPCCAQFYTWTSVTGQTVALPGCSGHKTSATKFSGFFFFFFSQFWTNQLENVSRPIFPLLVNADSSDFGVKGQLGSELYCQKLCQVPGLRIFSLLLPARLVGSEISLHRYESFSRPKVTSVILTPSLVFVMTELWAWDMGSLRHYEISVWSR